MPAAKTRVLVIDDEQDLRDGCERILRRMDCEVSKAPTGEEGIELFKQERHSVVLSDLKMPGIDGIEVLRRLREIDPDLLVIILTGYATIETAIEAMKQGAYDFVAKPFEPDQLRIVVGRALEKLEFRRQTDELEQEKNRTLADLGTEKSRISAIVESLPNSIVVTNKDGNVVLMNPLFRERFDIDPEKESGDRIESYIQDEGLCRLIHEISRGEHVGGPTPRYEITLPNELYLLALGQSVLDDDGESIGAVIIFTNITDLKNFDQLKSDFVAKVSHELRSPLATIHEQMGAVIEDLPTDDEENRYILTRAKEKTNGLISFIGDLLDLSRIEAGNDYNKPRPLNMVETLNSIVEFLTARAESKEQVLNISHTKEVLPELTADPLAVESIFGNLITNAIKYTPRKGKISVHTNLIDNCIVVTVSDTGFGMDAGQQEMIFEKFYRVKNEKTRHIVGTGLGLSIVKGLVDSMNGSITVKSEPDKGSSFTVVLPCG